MKLLKVKPIQSKKGLAFFRGWEIALLLIPPFYVWASFSCNTSYQKIVRFVQLKLTFIKDLLERKIC